MKNQACQSKHSQSGNVLIIIFIAIALFAALSYVLMKSSRSTGTISNEAAKLAATEILQYGQKVEQAIKTMVISGCAANQISFERAPFNGTDTDYTNPNSPSNFSCHVFHPKGGAVAVISPNPRILKGTSTVPAIFRNKYIFSGHVCLSDVGSGGSAYDCWNNGTLADTDLIMVLTDVSDDLCNQINILADIPPTKYIMHDGNGNFFDTPAQSFAFFKGTYGQGADSGHIYIYDLGISQSPISGKRFACYLDQTPNANVVYYVVLAR